MANNPAHLWATRPADPVELERMSGCVRWMYEHGQAVVLWRRTGQISLAPDTLPAGDVLILRNGGGSQLRILPRLAEK